MNLEREDRVNWSTLKHILTSPKHYMHALQEERPDTDALRVGRAVHCAVLEPWEFINRFPVKPSFHRGMNDETARDKGYDGGKQAAAAWDQAHAATGLDWVEKDEYETVLDIAQAVNSDPHAIDLIQGGHPERAIEWTDWRRSIQCRGRIDYHSVERGLVELKTTRNLAGFGREAARLLYHAQIAWYYDGLIESGFRGQAHDVAHIIAVENVPPYDVAVFRFDADDLEAGREVYRTALDRLVACRTSGVWPGIGGGMVRRIDLPDWAMAQEMTLTMGGEELI